MKMITLTVLAVTSPWMGCRKNETPSPATAPTAKEGVWFHEVATEAKVNFQHVREYTKNHYLPEIMSGGAAVFDYDGDGFLDIYLVQGGGVHKPAADRPTNRLFRNRRDGTFEDVTEASGTGDRGFGMGCACGDYDNDGDVDLYVTNVGANTLYRNNGDGTFTELAAASGVDDHGWGSSAAFVDYDRDGDLDLFVVNYVDWSLSEDDLRICRGAQDEPAYCSPAAFSSPSLDTLYRNDGHGKFTKVRSQAGMQGVKGYGLGIAHGDFNADGFPDFFVANDSDPNHFWISDGQGKFVESAMLKGCAVNHVGTPEAGMGIVAADVNQDGRLDLFLSHLMFETNTLYLNQGEWFEDATSTFGLGASSVATTGFGVSFVDFDHDGRLDVYIANGRVKLEEPIPDRSKPYSEPNLLLKGGRDGHFTEVRPRGGTEKLLIEASRAAAFGDLDNDGDIDIVVVNNGSRVHILRNVAGARGNWIMFRVFDRAGHVALGALVRLETGPSQQWRTVQRAYSYCASNDPRVHFGLGRASRVQNVTVRWPDRTVETFGGFAAGAIHDLRRGTGQIESAATK